jgi:N-acyl-D-amino-acid deacylase
MYACAPPAERVSGEGDPGASPSPAESGAGFENPVSPSGAHDLLVTGALVLDGGGGAGRIADVLVQQGRISWVGLVDPDTLEVAERVDAGGRVLAPGFIDAHAHWDLPEPPEFRNFLAQGVTTIVLGQDGRSPEVARLAAHLDRLDDMDLALNTAWMVGHNTVRMESGVGFGVADEAGRRRMAALVQEGLEAGAFGLTLGLEYDPGVRSDMEELVAVAAPVAAVGGVVMSHMRNEDADQVEASLAELLEQGRRAGVRVHASHLKVVLGRDTLQARRMLDMLAEARAGGVEATADLYPYTASFTGLSILFPDWARPPNDYAAVSRERREELLAHLQARVESRNGPEATLFGTGPFAGRTLAEAAEVSGRPWPEVLAELGPGGARAAYFVMDEEVMTTFLADPFVAVSSDGGPSMAHPRGYGTFTRVLSRHTGPGEVLSLEEAVRRMSGLPASILGLDDPGRVEVPRGRIRQGFAADLVLFDPANLEDRADFESPHTTALGMDRVWVAGEPVWEEGAPVPGAASGRVIRRLGGGADR